MSKLTHFNDDGNPHMVDVGEKDVTTRVAVAGAKPMSPRNISADPIRGQKRAM